MTSTTATQEPTITHIWSRFNPRWILTGALSGFLAGLVMILVASIVASSALGEWSQSFKVLGATFYGGQAMAFGSFGMAGLMGALLHFSLSILYGVVFAQLVDENSRFPSILALSLVTAFIIWIFGSQLFMPSVNRTLKELLPTPFSIYLHIIFGFSFAFAINALRKVFLRCAS